MGKKKEKDCPAEVLRLAKTQWQKAVALQFHQVESALIELKTEIRQLKWVIGSILIPIIILILKVILS